MVFNVREYGAAGDGTTLDTAAFQRTVDEASRAGGTVLVPQGEYVVGTVFLKSHVTLEITSRARILGSTEIGTTTIPCPRQWRPRAFQECFSTVRTGRT